MLSHLVEELAGLVESIVLTAGLPGIVLIAFLENVFPPIPSEFLYPLAGKLAYDGQVSLLMVILAGAIGSLIGSSMFYAMGYRLGNARIRELLSRYGTLQLWRFRLTPVTPEDYDKALSAFHRRGGTIVLISRTMPVIHSIISIPAGVARMNYLKFVIYTFLGSLLWIVPTVLVGYILGSQWETALYLLDVYEWVWYALIACGLVYYIFKRVRRHRRKSASEEDVTVS